jgi:hypothetical protein
MEDDILDDASRGTKIIITIKISFFLKNRRFFMTMDDANGLHLARNALSYDR